MEVLNTLIQRGDSSRSVLVTTVVGVRANLHTRQRHLGLGRHPHHLLNLPRGCYNLLPAIPIPIPPRSVRWLIIQGLLAGSRLFVVPFTRVSVEDVFPIPSKAVPFTNTFGAATLSMPCRANASNLSSSASSFSSLSLRSSSAIFKNTKR